MVKRDVMEEKLHACTKKDIQIAVNLIIAHLFLFIVASILRDLKRSGGAGRPRTIRMIAFEEEVLNRVEEEHSTSVRATSHNMGASTTIVWRAMHEQLLRPYHIQRVQGLNPGDYPNRIAFCQWFLSRNLIQPNFGRIALFSDEACFTRDGVFNSRNSHIWDENPHAVAFTRHQQQFSVNIWAGIVGENLIVYLLPPRLNAHIYLQFIQNILPGLLQNVPLDIRRDMWFQHDGAPAHFSLNVR
ncbi:uncharacterized protein LOC105283860 [Ooceraea biroi]|uniref:uncharacterized protein LOC105283860 n=1 Tax=Ooceraea biroi TaxID=2015173 RepID=UPI000F0944BD|nr:uncharacterized protein LOC105283860 [Ooceraea biroi]